MKSISYTDESQREFLLALVERIPDGTVAALARALTARDEIESQTPAAGGAWAFSDATHAALRAAVLMVPGITHVRAMLEQ